MPRCSSSHAMSKTDNSQALSSVKVKTQNMRSLVESYLHLTKEILPSLSRSSRQDWPVREDHCFQRIVLDTICGGVWYEHLVHPAYKNLTHDEAQRAVDLCYEIAEGHADLRLLNNQSLIWRGKR